MLKILKIARVNSPSKTKNSAQIRPLSAPQTLARVVHIDLACKHSMQIAPNVSDPKTEQFKWMNSKTR